MDKEYNGMYLLGREARAHGYGTRACNIPQTRAVQRAWWLAGWHDEDMEHIAKGGKGGER